jgi:hypothetical protein
MEAKHLVRTSLELSSTARGRDASDVAISTTFGPTTLESFRVWTDEVPSAS